jgi:hypothetical protein
VKKTIKKMLGMGDVKVILQRIDSGLSCSAKFYHRAFVAMHSTQLVRQEPYAPKA